MCKYCEETTLKNNIAGKSLKVLPTKYMMMKPNRYKLDCFILKCTNDKKAGLMIGTYEGYSYININYCPMCGRKLGECIK